MNFAVIYSGMPVDKWIYGIKLNTDRKCFINLPSKTLEMGTATEEALFHITDYLTPKKCCGGMWGRDFHCGVCVDSAEPLVPNHTGIVGLSPNFDVDALAAATLFWLWSQGLWNTLDMKRVKLIITNTVDQKMAATLKPDGDREDLLAKIKMMAEWLQGKTEFN